MSNNLEVVLRVCSRSLRTIVSCVWTEHRNWSLHRVNEGFDHRLSATGNGAVDLEQVLSVIRNKKTPAKVCLFQYSALLPLA